MIAALAFIPEHDVDRVYNILSNNVDGALDVILDYMEENYIDAIRKVNLAEILNIKVGYKVHT